MGYYRVHHEVNVLTDFNFINRTEGEVSCDLECKFCKAIVPSGIMNVINHLEKCELHPVFVTDGGFDFKKMEPTGKRMTYGEYLKTKLAPSK